MQFKWGLSRCSHCTGIVLQRGAQIGWVHHVLLVVRSNEIVGFAKFDGTS
jgi:hypothetical protein